MSLSRSGFELNEIWSRQRSLVESDSHIRGLHRRWKETGSVEDGHRLAQAHLRAGDAHGARETLTGVRKQLNPEDKAQAHAHAQAHDRTAEALAASEPSSADAEAHDDHHNKVFDFLHPHFHNLSTHARRILSRSAHHIAGKLHDKHEKNGHLPTEELTRLGDAISSMKGSATGTRDEAHSLENHISTKRRGDGVIGYRDQKGNEVHHTYFSSPRRKTATSNVGFFMKPGTGNSHREDGKPSAYYRSWNNGHLRKADDEHYRNGESHREEEKGPASISSEYHPSHSFAPRGPQDRLKSQTTDYHNADQGGRHRENGPAHITTYHDGRGSETHRFERNARKNSWIDGGKRSGAV